MKRHRVLAIQFAPPSTRAGAEGRARGEGARAQTKVRAERWGNVAEKVAAARAAAVVADGIGGISAQPLAASFAERIDALHGEAGQILHLLSLSDRYAQIDSAGTTRQPSKIDPAPGGSFARRASCKTNPWP
jgi:hypothetical protein